MSQEKKIESLFHQKCLEPIIISDIWCSKWNKQGWKSLTKNYENNMQQFWDYAAMVYIIWIINKNLKINVIQCEDYSINEMFNDYCKNGYNDRIKTLDPTKDIITHFAEIDLDNYKKYVKWIPNASGEIPFWDVAYINIHRTLNNFDQNVKKLAQRKMYKYWNTAPFRMWRIPELQKIKDKPEEKKKSNKIFKHFKNNGITLTQKELTLIKLNKIHKMSMIMKTTDCRDMGLKPTYARIFRLYK